MPLSIGAGPEEDPLYGMCVCCLLGFRLLASALRINLCCLELLVWWQLASKLICQSVFYRTKQLL